MVFCCPAVLTAEIGLQLSPPGRIVQLFTPEYAGLSGYGFDSTLFKAKPPYFKRITVMDSSGTFISITESIDKTELILPLVVDLDTYIDLRLKFDRRELWKQSVIKKVAEEEETEGGALELEIPVRIKNATFTRIFGSDRVRLRVTGNISFDLSGRSEKRSGVAISRLQQTGSFSPRFNQTQQFTIEGKIGEKVTVSVEQNSEATFDFENTLRLRYDGDEDEIIRSIEAGNIGLSLPSTKYVIFGGSNKGLFGIKSEMQLGDFYLTSIASLEKGEQQKLSISGSSSENRVTVHDYDFIRNRYFFIDTYYKEYYEKGFSDDLQQWFFEHEGKLIREFDVYKSGSYANKDVRKGIAVLDPQNAKWTNLPNLDSVKTVAGEVEKRSFLALEQGKDYDYDYARGFFWLNQDVQDNEVLAIAYKTDEKQVGTLFSDVYDDTTKRLIVRLIKPQSIQPAYTDVWPLMMRNVYSLGGSSIEEQGFDLSIEYNLGGEHEQQQQVPPTRLFLNLMGLDRVDENKGEIEGGDKKVDKNPFLIDLNDGVVIFPCIQPFDPLPGSRFANNPNVPGQEGLADTNRVRIYNTNNQDERIRSTKFEIVVTSKSIKSTFDLGFNVLEGSEEVLLNGAKLNRNEDYLIDYFTGQLTLVSARAKRSSSNLEIKYEKATIFQLDKKTIFGGRGEFRFWDDSFVALTALYMNRSTLEQRVRIGQEPFSNFVWDLNTALKFKPRFLTKLVDALPLIETADPSFLDIEAEFAQILPDPNTLNNPSTGDENGVAYVDDFEGTKRSTTLGIRFMNWTQASPPNFIGQTEVQDTTADQQRGRLVWFNPFNQVLIKDIWPNRDVNAETGQTTDVLGLELWRNADQDPAGSWAGIMRSTASFANQQRTKFIELWVKEDTVSNPTYVRFNIDIGQISEDWWMKTVRNGQVVYGSPSWRALNTEDQNTNGVLDEGEDTGIDGFANGQVGDDPLDNWQQPDRGTDKYDGINGTEGNSQAQASNYPDTEDLDGNGDVNLINEYFEYSFTLDPRDETSKKWLTGSTAKGWRQYRIPLKEYLRKEGEPDTTFQSIYYVRLWFSNLTAERKKVYIATFDFIGNEWEEEGIALQDTARFLQNDSLFSITVYNSEENATYIPGGPEPYTSPPGVSGVRDRITKAMSKEQSMVYRISNLPAGASAQAYKTLYGDIISLINYRRIRMFVHGDQNLPSNPAQDSSRIRVYIRFGADINNYYEYGQDIYAGWTSLNNFDIDLEELSRTKFLDPVEQNIWIRYLADKPGGYYKVVGTPSLTTIRYFRIGVTNRDQIRSYSGEIWFDEMRVTDVRQESGTAMRMSASLKVADLLTLNGNWESVDADFHDIKAQFGAGNTLESQNYSGVFNFDRFLPDSWNFSVPIDARAAFSRNIPKYYPRTDILTNYSNNTIEKKAKSLFGLRVLDPYLDSQISYSEIYGAGTTIKKRAPSEFWLLRYTVDQVTVDVDYSYKNSRNYQTEISEARQWHQSLSYNVPFGKNNFIAPFKSLSAVPLLKYLADQKVYYSPASMSMNLDISDSKQKDKLRSESTVTYKTNTITNRSLNMSYRLVPSISLGYNRTHKADADYVGLTGKKLFQSIVTKGNFGKDIDIAQGFKADYKPTLVSWMTVGLSYGTNFQFYFSNLTKNQRQSNNRISRRIDFSFNPNQVANLIYSPKKKTEETTPRTRRPASTREQVKPVTEDEDQQKEKGKEGGDQPTEAKSKKPKINVQALNPLRWIFTFFDSWKKFQTSYSWDENTTNFYIMGMPSWDYQFGLTRNPGVRQDTTLTNGAFIGPSVTSNKSLRSSISFDIAKNVTTSFSHDWASTASTNNKTRSGNESITYLAWGKDPEKDFKGVAKDMLSFIPDWNVKIGGLEKILFFPAFAKTVNLEHARSGKYTSTLKLAGKKLVPSGETFTHNYQPFIGISINWKIGITSSIRLNNSTTYNFQSAGGSSRTETGSFTISASYATKGGFKIPIPIWPFKGKSFKNEINFSLAFDKSSNKTFQKQINQANFQETQKNSSWKLRPSATYRFNTRVSGSMFYETGITENKISGKYSWNEFGISVNIAIRD
jgi:hypothetical protein